MPRPIPTSLQSAPNSPPLVVKATTLDFKITTALYGGGVEAGLPDRVTPIRATEVRAALRFWWRASRGSMFGSLEKMREMEGEIWGDTDRLSPIIVEIVDARLGTEVQSMRREGTRTVYEEPRYALFPAQSKDKDRNLDCRPIFKGGSFQLKYRCPAHLQPEMNAALRYWIHFGGIGSRTRRGLGALHCSDPYYVKGANWYQPAELPAEASRTEWPQIKGGFLAMGTSPQPHQRAWEMAVDLLKDFRQQRTGHMGRSLWPEPDAIRRKTGQSSPAHATPITTVDEFPRSQFGMPILFQFRQDAHRRGDPDLQTLVPTRNGKAMERMASPVILKPMAVSATHSLPICLFLNAPGAQGLVLKEAGIAVQAGGRDVLAEFRTLASTKHGMAVYGL